MGRSRGRNKNKKTDSSTSQEKSGSRRDKKKRKRRSRSGPDNSINSSSGSSRSRRDGKSSRSRNADKGSPSESSRSSSASMRQGSIKPAVEPPTSAKPPPVSVIRHMIAVETRTAFEKFFGQRRAQGSHHEPLPAGDNKKLAVCIIVTVLILVLGGLVGSIVFLREKDGGNGTNVTTTAMPTSTKCPYVVDPKDVKQTGRDCKKCSGKINCATCCKMYYDFNSSFKEYSICFDECTRFKLTTTRKPG